MISVQVYSLNYGDFKAARDWLVARNVRLIGFGGKPQGFNEVQSMPYVGQSKLGGPPDYSGYDYHFTDDLRETAMLFKLTFGGA